MLGEFIACGIVVYLLFVFLFWCIARRSAADVPVPLSESQRALLRLSRGRVTAIYYGRRPNYIRVYGR